MPDPSPSLDRYLDDLYPLARVLAGEAHADDLVAETYRRAAETPSHERPGDVRSWLLRLLLETRRTHTDDKPRGPGDPFGQEAARQTAEKTLPVAFASCSAQERALLTLDVLTGASTSELGEAFGITAAEAREQCDEAHTALRAALRDALTGPERMLVDVALSDGDLREALREVLMHRFHPTPPSLHTKVRALLADASSSSSSSLEAGETEDPRPPEENGENSGPTTRLRMINTRSQVQERSRQHRSRSLDPPSFDLRRALVGVFVVVAVVLGGYVLSVALSPPPSPTSGSLTAFLAQPPVDVETVLSSADSAEVVRVLDDTYDRRAAVPRIQRASLSGLGVLNMPDGPALPVLLYTDSTADGEALPAYLLGYAALDTLAGRARLDTRIRQVLEQENQIVPHRAGDRSVLYWRTRDDIYALISPTSNPQSLAARVELSP